MSPPQLGWQCDVRFAVSSFSQGQKLWCALEESEDRWDQQGTSVTSVTLATSVSDLSNYLACSVLSQKCFGESALTLLQTHAMSVCFHTNRRIGKSWRLSFPTACPVKRFHFISSGLLAPSSCMCSRTRCGLAWQREISRGMWPSGTEIVYACLCFRPCPFQPSMCANLR